MADIKFDLLDSAGVKEEECEGERGERGKRGHRGHRGRDGFDGNTGPTGPTGPTGATGSVGPTGSTGPAPSGPPILAAAHVAADGSVLANTGFSSIARLGAGIYALTLTNPEPDVEVIPVVTAESSPFITVGIAEVAGGVIGVRMATGAGIATSTSSDSNFYIVVSLGA